jgi:hypothetical protein
VPKKSRVAGAGGRRMAEDAFCVSVCVLVVFICFFNGGGGKSVKVHKK